MRHVTAVGSCALCNVTSVFCDYQCCICAVSCATCNCHSGHETWYVGQHICLKMCYEMENAGEVILCWAVQFHPKCPEWQLFVSIRTGLNFQDWSCMHPWLGGLLVWQQKTNQLAVAQTVGQSLWQLIWKAVTEPAFSWREVHATYSGFHCYIPRLVHILLKVTTDWRLKFCAPFWNECCCYL